MGADVARNFVFAVAKILDFALSAYMWIIVIRAVLSFVSPDPYNPIVRTLYALTEPLLSRLRRRFPLMAGSIDFSPMVVILVILFLQYFLVSSLKDLALRLG